MSTKKCKKCLVEKSIEEFYTNFLTKDNYENICKACKNSYQKEHNKKVYQDKKNKFLGR